MTSCRAPDRLGIMMMDPNPVQRAAGILSFDRQALSERFDRLVLDPGCTYSVFVPELPPQRAILPPGWTAKTYTIRPDGDEQMEFYVDEARGPGSVAPCWRLFARSTATWKDIAGVPALDDVHIALLASAVIEFEAPPVLLDSGPRIMNLFRRFQEEYSRRA